MFVESIGIKERTILEGIFNNYSNKKDLLLLDEYYEKGKQQLSQLRLCYEVDEDEHFPELRFRKTNLEELKSFIDSIAKAGYIDDNIEAKEVFFTRFTGKANGELFPSKEKIVWKKHPKYIYYFVSEYCKRTSGKYDKVRKFFEFDNSYNDFLSKIQNPQNHAYFRQLPQDDLFPLLMKASLKDFYNQYETQKENNNKSNGKDR